MITLTLTGGRGHKQTPPWPVPTWRFALKRPILLAGASALALSTSLIGGFAPSASAVPRTPAGHASLLFGSGQDTVTIMANQPALDSTVAQIRTASAAAPSGSGLGGVSVDALHNTVHLYWHGLIPARVSAIVTAARREHRTIAISKSPYTEAQLVKESQRIIASHPSNGVKVVSAGPDADGTGLALGVAPAASSNRATAAVETAAVQSTLRSVTKYPFTVSAMTADQAQGWTGSSTMNRAVGGPGLYNMAGEHINMADGHICSAGFAATYGGHDVVLTAAHCGWTTFTRNDGTTIGRTVQSSTTYDIQAISGTNSYSYGDVWLGPDYYDTSGNGQSAEEVSGVSGNSTGDWICTSGAETGYVCDIEVYAAGQTLSESNGVTYENLIFARDKSPNHAQIVAGGDSGGPVFFPQSNGTILAKGEIQAGLTQSGIGGQTNCTSTAAIDDGNPCYDLVAYEDINLITSSIGATIKHF